MERNSPGASGGENTDVGARPAADPLEGVRAMLRLRTPDGPPAESLLPTGTRTVTPKDVAISFVFLLQIGWFLLSLTDPMGEPNPLLKAALSSGGDVVDQMEARKAAASEEYAAMLRDAAQNEAVPPCATAKLDDPYMGGCSEPLLSQPASLSISPTVAADASALRMQDPEYARTRGLDASREWIRGPTASDRADF